MGLIEVVFIVLALLKACGVWVTTTGWLALFGWYVLTTLATVALFLGLGVAITVYGERQKP